MPELVLIGDMLSAAKNSRRLPTSSGRSRSTAASTPSTNPATAPRLQRSPRLHPEEEESQPLLSPPPLEDTLPRNIGRSLAAVDTSGRRPPRHPAIPPPDINENSYSRVESQLTTSTGLEDDNEDDELSNNGGNDDAGADGVFFDHGNDYEDDDDDVECQTEGQTLPEFSYRNQ